jgi:hypothetical protein
MLRCWRGLAVSWSGSLPCRSFLSLVKIGIELDECHLGHWDNPPGIRADGRVVRTSGPLLVSLGRRC